MQIHQEPRDHKSDNSTQELRDHLLPTAIHLVKRIGPTPPYDPPRLEVIAHIRKAGAGTGNIAGQQGQGMRRKPHENPQAQKDDRDGEAREPSGVHGGEPYKHRGHRGREGAPYNPEDKFFRRHFAPKASQHR